MTKIKFSCPGCKAKLKVPDSLAGVAGPCPKCGATIVAPLKSEEEPEPVKSAAQAAQSPPPTAPQQEVPEPRVAPAPAPVSKPVPPQPQIVQKPVQPVPVVAEQPVIIKQPVSPPPIIQQPVPTVQPPQPTIQQPVHQPAASANSVGFPRPLEQVSRTAMVALANSPVNSPVYPKYNQSQAAYSSVPAGSPDREMQSRAVHNFASPQQRQAESEDLIPEDIFNENPAPSHGQGQHEAQQGTSRGYEQAYVPGTQPIQVKNRQEEQVSSNSSQAMPRLDVSLGDSGGGALSTGQSGRSEPTQIHLPEVGSERSDNFSINRPQPVAGKEGYRPPNPVSLTPPGGYPHQPEPHVAELPQQEVIEEPVFEEPVFEEVQEDYSYQVEPEFPMEDSEIDYDSDDDSGLPGSGDGSVAAFLAEAMDSSPDSNRDRNSGKSKDEILDELLGVAPKSRKKKKGLSGSTKFMLSVLAAVAVCAAIGVYYAIDKMGGFSLAGENVFGEQGLKNLQGKDALKKYTVPGSIQTDSTVDPKALEKPIQTEPTDVSAPPDKIDLDKIIQGVVNSGELEDDMASRLGIDTSEEDPPLTKEEIEGPKVPEVTPVNPVAIVPNAPAPSPLPSRPKENYNPPPFFAAPGPDDPPLKNTHDLVDAFMRAPNWQARIPYTYQGESLRPAIEAYYQTWQDFSLDRFKMKLFQMELEKEFGGPFWVYQITKSDADPGGVPMILRVENGNLKVDWQVFSEFSDQHFVKFREGKMSAPHSFRLVAERVSEYPGADRPGFTDIDDYICFELNPPYGGYRAFSEYAFVKKGTPVAKIMDEKIALGDDPLAVILTIDRQGFSHGIRHYVIKDFVDEGWFK